MERNILLYDIIYIIFFPFITLRSEYKLPTFGRGQFSTVLPWRRAILYLIEISWCLFLWLRLTKISIGSGVGTSITYLTPIVAIRVIKSQLDFHYISYYLGIFTEQYKTNKWLLEIYWVPRAFVPMFITLKLFISRAALQSSFQAISAPTLKWSIWVWYVDCFTEFE